MSDEPLTDKELDELDALIAGASPGPWEAFVEGRNNESGSTFIGLGRDLDVEMYVYHDMGPTPDADLDFIAAARNYLPRLMAEVRRRRASE